MNDVAIPMAMGVQPGNVSLASTSAVNAEKPAAATMTGALSRYEKRIAATAGMPRVSPTEMVAADREMPGRSAAACAAPIMRASHLPISFDLTLGSLPVRR